MTTSINTEKKAARRTPVFRTWFDGLRSDVTKAIVAARIERVQMGLYGDVKPVGAGVSELRIDYGPGLRVYFTETLDNTIVLLLVGGDKSHQDSDIREAKRILADLKQQRTALNKATIGKE
jgi:putative addiction module killer protein